MMLIRYHEAAEQELLHEIGYLENQRKGLGRRLLAEIKRSESLIAQFPESAAQIQPSMRKMILRTFKYALIYTIEDGSVIILAVAHHKRRPNYWFERVSEKEIT